MRKFTLIILSLLLCQFTFAQKNVIKFNPVGLLYGKYNLQYERMITDYSSASISGSFIKPSFMENEIFSFLETLGLSSECSGGAVELDYRLYSKNKPGPQGFYIGPYFRYTGIGFITRLEDLEIVPGNDRIDYIEEGFRASRIGLGLKFGAQWLLFNRVTIDWNFFGLGADYYLLKLFSEGSIYSGGEIYSEQDVTKTGFFMPAFNTDFSISYAF